MALVKRPEIFRVPKKDIQLKIVGIMERVPWGGNCGITCVMSYLVLLSLVRNMSIIEFGR